MSLEFQVGRVDQRVFGVDKHGVPLALIMGLGKTLSATGHSSFSAGRPSRPAGHASIWRKKVACTQVHASFWQKTVACPRGHASFYAKWGAWTRDRHPFAGKWCHVHGDTLPFAAVREHVLRYTPLFLQKYACAPGTCRLLPPNGGMYPGTGTFLAGKSRFPQGRRAKRQYFLRKLKNLVVFGPRFSRETERDNLPKVICVVRGVCQARAWL